MNTFRDKLLRMAKREKMHIILPEGNDIRTLAAAEVVLAEGIADLTIIGDEEALSNTGYNLDGATIINNRTSDKREEYTQKLYELRQHRGMTMEMAEARMDSEIHFALMMLHDGLCDGMVAGACHSTGDVLRPSLKILKTAKGCKMVSSYFILEVPDCYLGENGMFAFGDCALTVNPNEEQLAYIALNTARGFKKLTGYQPRVAMLSHSSHGSAFNEQSSKVIKATEIAKDLAPNLLLDGELQLDAAIIPSIGFAKAPESQVAGKANVLIFPNIDAGNIGYKLVERLAHATAYGPIMQGIGAPVNDLSRGCSSDDIISAIAITCIQAQEQKAGEWDLITS